MNGVAFSPREPRRLARVAELREQLQLARAFGLPRTLGISLRACGLVEGGRPASSCLQRRSRPLSARSHRWSSPARERTMAPSCGARAAATRPAGSSHALDLADGLGARRIAAQARTELTAGGAKPRREAITGRDTLTAGELRDTRLTAEAMTNRKIAQALFTTTKTA